MSNIPTLPPPTFWGDMQTVNSGESLAQMADGQPVLLVFLRFFGCSFCREAISDIAKRRKKLEKRGLRIVFVHMAADADTAEKFFKNTKSTPLTTLLTPKSASIGHLASVAAHRSNSSA